MLKSALDSFKEIAKKYINLKAIEYWMALTLKIEFISTFTNHRHQFIEHFEGAILLLYYSDKDTTILNINNSITLPKPGIKVNDHQSPELGQNTKAHQVGNMGRNNIGFDFIPHKLGSILWL